MEVLLNDSSVLLNLLAAECLEQIAADTGWQFAICPAVRDEVKKLRDFHTGEMIEVDLTPHIASGLLHVLELAGEKEEILYVEQSIVVDDGEAMSIAIAASRRFALAIDDKRAGNHARATFPEIELWSTPEILKRWHEVGRIDSDTLRQAISLIETRARYFPARSHALASWWQQFKLGTAGEETKL
jgi:predicted nucleic acid-binding protein